MTADPGPAGDRCTCDQGGIGIAGDALGTPDRRPGRPAASNQELHGWRRAVAFPLELFIRVYRLLVSPLLGDVCRFYPTCSSYGLTAVRRFGLIRGAWLILTRLVRCHPWNPGGVDHVPLRGADGRPMSHNGASPEH